LMTDREFVVWHTMKNEWGQCSWSVSGGPYRILTVNTPYGSKATQLGGSPPKVLAKMLMKEIDAQAKCALKTQEDY
jgi:hypothetical protein